MEKVPTEFSNRRFIKQMELWGWKRGRRMGDYLMMDHALAGISIPVIPPHSHSRPPSEMVHTVYEHTCGGNARMFWSKTIDIPAPEEPTPAAPQPPEPEENNVKDKVTRGNASRVLAALSARHSHEAVTPAQAAEWTGLSPTLAGRALSYLASVGHVERVLRGTYRLSPALAAQSTIAHHHGGQVESLRGTVPEVPTTPRAVPEVPPVVPATVRVQVGGTVAPPAQPAPPVRPVTPPTPAPTGDELDPEADLDTLLELILPADYKFKPAHLRHIRRWQDATADLLAALRG